MTPTHHHHSPLSCLPSRTRSSCAPSMRPSSGISSRPMSPTASFPAPSACPRSIPPPATRGSNISLRADWTLKAPGRLPGSSHLATALVIRGKAAQHGPPAGKAADCTSPRREARRRPTSSRRRANPSAPRGSVARGMSQTRCMSRPEATLIVKRVVRSLRRPNPTPEPCKVKINATKASNISAALTSAACRRINPQVSCPPDENAAGVQLSAGGAWLTAFGWLAYILA
ncbi:hypothetical protein BJX96DRAFT_142211 [Aspergillus floccosus]